MRNLRLLAFFVFAVAINVCVGQTSTVLDGAGEGEATAATPKLGDADFPRRSPGERHDKKVAAVKSGDYDLVLIGDSITHTLGELGGKYEPMKAVWEKYYTPRKAINLGFNGYRTEQILWNLQNGELDFKRSPKVAMLLIGTNNTDDRHFKKVHSAEEVFAGTKAIVELIRKRHPTTKILVLRIFPRGGDDEEGVSPPAFNSSKQCIETCRRAGLMTKELADNKHVYWLDVNSVFLRKNGDINTDLMWDLLHPSPAGAEAWSKAVEPTLVRLLNGERQNALSTRVNELPSIEPTSAKSTTDYLLDPTPFKAQAAKSEDGRELVLDNGLIRRTWRVSPNGACVGFDNLMTGQSMLRSVRPEARVTIDGEEYDVGGLIGQPNHAYLSPDWLDEMKSDPNALRLVGFEIGKPVERFGWGRRRHTSPNAAWPPKGVALRMDYGLPTKDAVVSVHYELYDGIPAMSKRITIRNNGQKPISIDRYTGEELAVVEHSNPIETRDGSPLERPDYLHVETDFAFGGFHPTPANRHVVHWRSDPTYKTQVNYLKQSPCLLVCEPTYGPAQRIAPGDEFEGFRVFELAYDDGNRERRGLAYRRMFRTIAPWVTENPLTHHLLTNKSKVAREAIDKAAEVGFEAIIFSFGSGFNMENRDAEFLARWKEVADYAKSKGIELGSYSLFSSRGVGKEHMAVLPEGQKATHGKMPAMTSAWGQEWIETVRSFYQSTGFSQFENDGPFPGDIDITPRPPLQHGIKDSRWAQWQQNNRLYRGLRADGIYINQPDYHFLNGGNKSSMGYREVNWSLPRAQQVIHTRQNIYDGTWMKTPSMGWMHVPLSEYHGGGAAATIEPLHEHLDHYRLMMLSNLGMGVQAHYRGPRIYDTNETREMVKANVDWFKKYRDILESDIVHGRRADGRDLDWVLHVNPQLENKGMLCVYNPLGKDVTKTLRVNLYYTGLTERAQVISDSNVPLSIDLERDHTVEMEVKVPANGMRWYLIRSE